MSRKKKRIQKIKKGRPPEDEALVFQEGVRLHQQGSLNEALDRYHEVLRIRPNHADALYLAGVVFHQSGNDASAVEYILAAIQHRKENENYLKTLKNVYNNLGLFYQNEGEHPKAIESYKKALDIDSSFTLALNNLGMVYYETGAYKDAVKYYERVFEIDENFFQAWLNLGLALNELGETEKALTCYEKAQKLNPESCQVLNNIGIIYQKRQHYKTAVEYFKQSIALQPEYPEAYYNLGCTYFDDGRFDDAVDCYFRCIEINSRYIPAYTNIGNAFLQKKMYRDAEQWYIKALEVDPLFADAYNNLGTLYNAQGNSHKAITHLIKAVELKPENATFQTNLGLAYRKSDNAEKAVECFKKTLELLPEAPEPYFNLGEAYKDLSLFSEAIECFLVAVTINPDFKQAYEPLSYLYMRRCQWENAEKYKNLVSETTKSELHKGGLVTETPYNCLIRCEDPEICYMVAKSWGDRIASEIHGDDQRFVFGKERKQNKKIRVAYLSNTFRDHPGGHLIAGMFGAHNRHEFEIFAYSYGSDDGSYYRRKVETESDRFVELAHLSDIDAAKCIYNDQIDILVDLRGFTMSGRVSICALRPAPVQVVYLGFPGSSGADFYDYIIVDKTIVPPQHIQFFSENVVYMPDCYQVNNNAQLISEDILTRKEEGLPERGIVFCSFNTEYKIEPVMFNSWMEILKKVPDSVLWLLKSSDEMVENLIFEAEKRGVTENRLVFAERMPKDKHLKRSQLADLAFDTRIYNGHTTTSDALWAGIPVITMPGNHFASRVSASLLKAAGLSELIVDDLEHYEKLAVEISTNKNKLDDLKRKTKENIDTAPLFNTLLFAQHIEKAYKIMWNRFKEDLPHEIIDI